MGKQERGKRGVPKTLLRPEFLERPCKWLGMGQLGGCPLLRLQGWYPYLLDPGPQVR